MGKFAKKIRKGRPSHDGRELKRYGNPFIIKTLGRPSHDGRELKREFEIVKLDRYSRPSHDGRELKRSPDARLQRPEVARHTTGVN